MSQFSTKGQEFPALTTNLFGSFNIVHVNDILSNPKDMSKPANVEFLKLVRKFVRSGKTNAWYDYREHKLQLIGNPSFYEGVDFENLTIRPTTMQSKNDSKVTWVAYSIGTINTNTDEDDDDDDDDFFAKYTANTTAEDDEDEEEETPAPTPKKGKK